MDNRKQGANTISPVLEQINQKSHYHYTPEEQKGFAKQRYKLLIEQIAADHLGPMVRLLGPLTDTLGRANLFTSTPDVGSHAIKLL